MGRIAWAWPIAILGLAAGAAGFPQSPAVTGHSYADAGQFILTNRRGTRVELLSRGATLLRVRLADAGQSGVDVVVGPGSDSALAATKRHYGGIIGRYAGRLHSPVAIDGARYALQANANDISLHGGEPGLDRAIWKGRPFQTAEATGVSFTHTSPDGDQNFPGTLTIEARYSLARASDTIALDIRATSDRTTVINLTNHVFFDLSGGLGLNCQTLAIDSTRLVQLDDRKMPTGRFDVSPARRPRPLGRVIAEGGIDTMFVLRGSRKAWLVDRSSGRRLTLSTNQKGLQVYTGNGFDGTDRDRARRPISRFAGIALEAGNFPDAPNVVGFPAAYVSPSQPYHWRTTWRFDKQAPEPCARSGQPASHL